MAFSWHAAAVGLLCVILLLETGDALEPVKTAQEAIDYCGRVYTSEYHPDSTRKYWQQDVPGGNDKEVQRQTLHADQRDAACETWKKESFEDDAYFAKNSVTRVCTDEFAAEENPDEQESPKIVFFHLCSKQLQDDYVLFCYKIPVTYEKESDSVENIMREVSAAVFRATRFHRISPDIVAEASTEELNQETVVGAGIRFNVKGASPWKLELANSQFVCVVALQVPSSEEEEDRDPQ
eukprot:gnl/Hemi2/17043_TR5668_c0_g1_i1.p1 gnl/Hemi2/17043_TR5668_c0_g1~~gnl/Hemi2/17043_TR5668_c0_g1_i1.p1  ORF type:complete len:237 (-),score=45.96 gnl/Hemi2/17043_TR5668_c0_g1_i1:390-1100(-)